MMSSSCKLPTTREKFYSCANVLTTAASSDRYRPNKHQNVFRCPPEVTHSLIVNMQDGDSSQTERCWTEESPGDNLHIIFQNIIELFFSEFVICLRVSGKGRPM